MQENLLSAGMVDGRGAEPEFAFRLNCFRYRRLLPGFAAVGRVVVATAAGRVGGITAGFGVRTPDPFRELFQEHRTAAIAIRIVAGRQAGARVVGRNEPGQLTAVGDPDMAADAVSLGYGATMVAARMHPVGQTRITGIEVRVTVLTEDSAGGAKVEIGRSGGPVAA